MTFQHRAKKSSSEPRFGNGLANDPLSDHGVTTQQVTFSQFQLAEQKDGFWGNLDLTGPDALPSPLPDNSVSLQANVSVGLVVQLVQHWNLQAVKLGDLVSHVSLAPKEAIQLVTTRVEKRTLERSREDSSQIESTTESSQTDRESLAVAQTASSAMQWNVSASMGFVVPGTPLTGNVTASYGKSKQNSVSKTSESVHEATTKASQTLRTQTKISVKTTSEVSETVSNSRVVMNPSDTDMLHLWGYEVIKRFQVTTVPRRAMAAVRIGVEPPVFDATFVATQGEFLKNALMDAGLADKLSAAQQAARSRLTSESIVGSGTDSEFDLLKKLLFEPELSSVFGVKSGGLNVADYLSLLKGDTKDLNLRTLAAGTTYGLTDILRREIAMEYREWQSAGVASILLAWQAMFALAEVDHMTWQNMPEQRLLLRRFMSMCRSTDWDSGPAGKLLVVSISEQFNNERSGGAGNMLGSLLARRIQMAMFLTTIGNETSPQGSGAGSASVDDDLDLTALLAHLELFRQLYAGRWLRFREKVGGKTVFGILVNTVLAKCTGQVYRQSFSRPFMPFNNWYRLDEVLVNGNEIIVPVADIPTAEFKASSSAGASAPLHYPSKSLGDSLINLAMSAWAFNQQLASSDEKPKKSSESNNPEPLSGLLDSIAANAFNLVNQSTQLPSQVPGATTPGVGGLQLGSAAKKELYPGKSPAVTNDAKQLAKVATGQLQPSTAALVSLGNPWEMERSSSVDVLANGVYVAGKFG